MAYAKLYFALVVEDQSRVLHAIGDLINPVSVPTVTGRVYDQSFSVAASGTQEVFNIDNNLGDFQILVIVSDTSAVMLEWTVDKNAGVGDEFATQYMAANVPAIIPSDIAYANYTSNFGGGTLDKIERLRVKNTATTTAKVRVFAVT